MKAHHEKRVSAFLFTIYAYTYKSYLSFFIDFYTVFYYNVDKGNDFGYCWGWPQGSGPTTAGRYPAFSCNRGNGLKPNEAIKEAVKWGISQGLLGTFLKEHGAEVTSMLMTEFNIDIAREVWQEEAREEALEEGRAEGVEILAKMLKEGIPLDEALEKIKTQSTQ